MITWSDEDGSNPIWNGVEMDENTIQETFGFMDAKVLENSLILTNWDTKPNYFTVISKDWRQAVSDLIAVLMPSDMEFSSTFSAEELAKDVRDNLLDFEFIQISNSPLNTKTIKNFIQFEEDMEECFNAKYPNRTPEILVTFEQMKPFLCDFFNKKLLLV